MIDLNTVRFGTGTHDATDAPTGDRDLCIMEAVAFVAGEPWSDAPTCASPVISAFLRTWQDALSHEDRDRLLPAAVWVPRLIGSRGTPEVEEQRAWLAADWMIRVHAPMWLDLTPSMRTHAEALRSLPAITADTLDEATQKVQAARDAARGAARDAARDAAWYAAGEAAGDAAWAAARDAAWYAARGAARDAAWAAAWAAARDAAWYAARDAARDAAGDAAWAAAWAAATTSLRPTIETLQHSALDLLDRMLACGREEEE